MNVNVTVMCDAGNITWYDRRRSELSNALPHMRQDITSIEIIVFSKHTCMGALLYQTAYPAYWHQQASQLGATLAN